jgi:hypothetical protein
MARKKLSGISSKNAEQVCASHYRGDKLKIEVCQATARSLIKKMVANKTAICNKWCNR